MRDTTNQTTNQTMNQTTNRAIPKLFADVVGNASDLFRKELQLLRAEASEKTTQAVTAAGMIVAGVVIVLVALIVLAFALVAALENAGLAPGWAALIVGGAFAIIAFVLISKGTKDLKATNLAPERTADSLSRDADMVKESVA